MNKTLTLLILLMACTQVVLSQWERLPLYGGHADMLVQNKYKSNEIFAIIERGGIYKSTDYGETWDVVVADIARLGWAWIREFDVMANGIYYASVAKGIWKSYDEGATWEKDIDLSMDLPFQYAKIKAHADSSFYILTHSGPFFLRSTNFGFTWDTVSFSSIPVILVNDLFILPRDSKIIFMYANDGEGKIIRTTDGGINWTEYRSMQKRTIFFGINPIIIKNTLSLTIWTDRLVLDQYPLVQRHYDFYESKDTGLTWNAVAMSAVKQDNDTYSSKKPTLSATPNVHLMSTHSTLYRSIDSGRTFSTVRDVEIQDLINIRSELLASSVPGFRRSSDLGETWQTYKGSRSLPGYGGIEFKVASPNIIFAIISSSGSELMQSLDGGITWTLLFSSKRLTSLQITNIPEVRYYVVSEDNEVLGGSVDQTVPDTLYRHDWEIDKLEIANAFPSDIYVTIHSAYQGTQTNIKWIYAYSKDYGATWTQHAVPPFRYGGIRIIPSLKERGTFVFVGSPFDPLNFIGMGLWLARDYGSSWQFRWQRDDLDPTNFHLLKNDLLFSGRDRAFSTDYGATWYQDFTGMVAGDREKLEQGFAHFSRQGTLIVANSSIWYQHVNGTWRKLRDMLGKPIIRSSPVALDITGSYLYGGWPYVGLYRKRAGNLTDVERTSPAPVQALLYCYPNPFSDNITISYRYSEVHSAQLRIINTLGQVVYSRDLAEDSGTFVWDGKTPGGVSLPNGIYMVMIIGEGRPVQSRFILHIK